MHTKHDITSRSSRWKKAMQHRHWRPSFRAWSCVQTGEALILERHRELEMEALATIARLWVEPALSERSDFWLTIVAGAGTRLNERILERE